jgi:ferrous iron transport protein B
MAASPVATRDARRLAPPPAPSREGIVLIGNPNVGKSALFGALTGRYVTVSNYPGTTVEVTRGAATIGGARVAVVDTPGTASFLPSSEDERVARDLLLEEPPAAAVLVADAKNLERALLLAVELSEMGVPFALCLNMMDEAATRGIAVDMSALGEGLGVDVVATVAVRRQGTSRLLSALERPRRGRLEVPYPAPIESGIADLAGLLPSAAVAVRALAVMVLSGDETLTPWLRARVDATTLARMEDVREGVRRNLRAEVGPAVQLARRRCASRLFREASRGAPALRSARPAAERLERLTTHRFWGLPILAGVLYASYLFVGVFGAGTLVDLLEDGLFGRVLNPAVTAWCARFIPWAAARDLVVGEYGLVTMGLTYALALVLPIVGTFFLAFGALEDSGYLPRLAVMVNRGFRTMGLNGKAVLPMVLGLGCDTMATLTTRILETRKERLIVTLLLALGVPCSAQLAVVLGLLAPLPASALWLWAGVVGGVIVLVGRLAARVVPGKGSDFVLELPPLRLPRPGNILLKTLARVEWYLKEAVPLFLLGTLILFVADRLRLLGALQRLGEPVVTGALGLPPETASAFVIGFLRRDFGAAGLYRLAEEGRLDPVQVLVAAVTITLFLPCVANFFMIAKERGWRVALAVAGVITPLAVVVGAALNAALRAFPGVLR